MFPWWSRWQKFADSSVASRTISASKPNLGHVPKLGNSAELRSARRMTPIRCASQIRIVVREDRSRGSFARMRDRTRYARYLHPDRSILEQLAGRSTIRTYIRVKAINGHRSISKLRISSRSRLRNDLADFNHLETYRQGARSAPMFSFDSRLKYCRGTSCVHDISTLRAKFPSLSSIYIYMVISVRRLFIRFIRRLKTLSSI